AVAASSPAERLSRGRDEAAVLAPLAHLRGRDRDGRGAELARDTRGDRGLPLLHSANQPERIDGRDGGIGGGPADRAAHYHALAGVERQHVGAHHLADRDGKRRRVEDYGNDLGAARNDDVVVAAG